MTNSNKEFAFDTQLIIGQKGEQLLRERWPNPVLPSNDRRWDFVDSVTNNRVELKTDTYSLSQTGNFFMEYYSDKARKTPGGPWRALQDGVNEFVYLFWPDRRAFIFSKLHLLVPKLGEIIGRGGAVGKTIRNVNWSTFGYTVPREKLREYYEEVDWADVPVNK